MNQKKLVALVLCLCMTFLAACGNGAKTMNNGAELKTSQVSISENDDSILEESDAEDVKTNVDTVEHVDKTTDSSAKEESVDLITALMEQKLEQKNNSPEDSVGSKFKKPESFKNIDLSFEDEEKDSSEDEKKETPEDNPAEDSDEPYDVTHPEDIEDGVVEYSDDTLLIKFKKSFNGKVNDSLKKAGVAKLETLFELEDAVWYTAYLDKKADVNAALVGVREISKVMVAEYNYQYETAEVADFDAAVKDNPMAGNQNFHDRCGIKDAWKMMNKDGIGGGRSGVTVAVIDTGIDYEHEDLKANMWVNKKEVANNGIDDDGNGYTDDYYGIDMTAKVGSGMDDNGHGTHVAGIIGASNNKTGIVGIAYNTKIMPIKAGDASGYFLQSNIAEAIIYAYENGADVINMSFGGSASSVAVQDALEVAYTRCVLVASAGNDGEPNEVADNDRTPTPNYPAAFSFVIGVMSVNNDDNESNFSNWDTTLYNSVEYEVYAPGEQILSTIPGNKYAKMSGTSMAAPVVAAQAAILRSFYEDTDTYPTKFIYGQIVSTADESVKCANPEKHMVGGKLHNIPGRVNFAASIEDLPTPDIGMSDYTYFDSVGFSADKAELTAGCETLNNGDGIVDAGEIIALGMTLKNRWGMSENTTVSISATNDKGVTNPYVTFLNNDINYGSVGTYSESDSGKLYSADGEMWIGWENPFYVKISENCPNDYTIKLNVTITYENGLDESDSNTYTSEDTITLKVRRGTILPNKITEDTTLTADNYYIIPNSMIVMEGATLTIKEGAQIQFWCSDPEDAYADTAITYLKVDGKLICEGTEEKPIEMFPSEWMSKYRVEIYTSGNGYASMEYTNVVNPVLTIDEAENCEFTQNYKANIQYRSLNSGKVSERNDGGTSSIHTMKNCAFYKIGPSSTGYTYSLSGSRAERCIFVDSNISFSTDTIFDGCVFYGNNNYWDSTNKGNTSILNSKNLNNTLSMVDHVVNEKDGTTYVLLQYSGPEYIYSQNLNIYIDIVNQFAKSLGGGLLSINSVEEFNLVKSWGQHEGITYGYKEDKLNGVFYNLDGTLIPLDINNQRNGKEFEYMYLWSNGLYIYDTSSGVQHNANDSWGSYIIEIPGECLASEIKLDEYIATLDTGETYQIHATVVPSTASENTLIYESEDESVATVDENGLVRPVAVGTTNIRVYAPDRAVYNYVTVNVKETVIPESISAKKSEITLAVGNSQKVGVDFTPVDSTKRVLTFTSADEKVATVDEKGKITAISPGDTVISITGYNGINTKVDVHCNIPAESISFKEEVYMTTLDADDGNDFYPVILPANATDTELSWKSSNPEVCYVDETGRLVKLKTGTASLMANVIGTDLKQEVLVSVTNVEAEPFVKKMIKYNNNMFALLEDGTLWMWGENYKYPTNIPVGKIKDFTIEGVSLMYVIDESGTVKRYRTEKLYDFTSVYEYDGGVSANVISNAVSLNSDFVDGTSHFAITDNGAVWAWGSNSYGQLGDGTTTTATFNSPVQVEISKPVTKVITNLYKTAFLTEAGDLYVSGDNSYVPIQIFGDVIDIIDYAPNSNHYIGIKLDDTYIHYFLSNEEALANIDMINESYERSYHDTYIENGFVYIKRYTSGFFANEDFIKINGISNAKDVFDFGSNVYVQTTDGRFFAIGSGNGYALGNGETNESTEPIKVYFGFSNNHESLSIESWNGITEGTDIILYDCNLIFDYNQKLVTSNNYGQIVLKNSMNELIAVSKSIELDKFMLSPNTPLITGEIYTLTIPAGAFTERGGTVNEESIFTFTYLGPGSTDDEGDSIEETVVTHESVIDEEKMADRGWDAEELSEAWNDFVEKGHNTRFYSNVILNRLNDDDTAKWLRITAPDSSTYKTISLGGNYWGTTNKELINKQILDFDDYQSLTDINEGEILTEAPKTTFPFVVDAYLETEKGKTNTVGNEKVTFVVNFNRPMVTSIPLDVRFGSAYPYADYQIEGEYASETQWRGETTLTTLIENGYQYWSISNGKAKGTSLKLYEDWGRFPFMIDTSAAQSLTMFAEPTETGIQLIWNQDEFDTLAGYNVYRSTAEDGQYTKLNKTVIPTDTKEWFDDTVIPGEKYYYNFTVVESDLTESEPSGKVTATALDTMAPDIYHSPVTHAFTGSNLVISATVTDNVAISSATLYYRTTGSEVWKSKEMTNLNDKYSASISAQEVTVDGLEYYIEATDGLSKTYKGTAEEPYVIIVQLAVEGSDIGDVDGSGAVELKDAMMVLMAINDRLNLTEEEFARADLDGNGELAAKEALRILQYVNGTIGSILGD